MLSFFINIYILCFKKFDFIEVLALTGALTAFCIIPTDHIAFQVTFAVFFCLLSGRVWLCRGYPVSGW